MTSSTFQTGPTWDLYYSVRDLYGALTTPTLGANESIGPAFYHRLTEVFENDEWALA